jgi:glycosyltransferase involved in cell wall biosynthesis
MRTETPRVSVLLAESGHAVGGTERVVWELATRLPRERYDVRVALSLVAGMDEFAASLTARGITVERLKEVDSRWDWSGMYSTWRRLAAIRPTLLHLHHVWPAADRYLAMLADAAGVRHLVITEHIVGEPHSAAQKALKRRELGRADAVTAVCGAVADSLVRDYGLPRARVRVVPNGADLPDAEAEEPAARQLRLSFRATAVRPLWVCVARLEEQKGHAVLLEALAELAGRGLQFGVALAGGGSLRESLERRAAELGLAERVRFLGPLDEIGPLLAAADAVVMPSHWEGLPLVLLEAQARGAPVVASAVGGIPEVIEDGVSGRLVPAGDAAALAEALAWCQRRPDLARTLGREGERRVRDHYTWDRVVDGFEAVYDEVLGLASFTPDDARAPEREGGRATRASKGSAR